MITVTVATAGAVPGLVPVKLAILPVPLAAKPMLVLLLVQLNTAVPPWVGVVNTIAAVGALLHTTWLATGLIIGAGLTVIVNVIGVPTQLTPPLVNVGVTMMVATTGALVVLMAVNVGISPVPLAAKPMDGWLLAQL